MNEADSHYAKHMKAQSHDDLNCYRDTNHDMMSRFGNSTTKEFHSWATNQFLIIGVFPHPARKAVGSAVNAKTRRRKVSVTNFTN